MVRSIPECWRARAHGEPEATRTNGGVGRSPQRVIRSAPVMRDAIRALFPSEWQPPRDVPRRVLDRVGFFRARTWLASHGEPVPDAGLYQPLYSPWLGDAEFEALFAVADGHTLVSRDRCFVLWKTLEQALRVPGSVMECGVFRGGTAALIAQVLTNAGAARRLSLFDSFEGFPDTTRGVDRFRAGDLGSTSVEDVRRLLSPYPFIELHVGFIPDTFAGAKIEQVAWAHVDVDIYQSVLDAILFIYPRLAAGGYLIFDDYAFPSCAGARRAVDEAFRDKPEVPLCLPTGQALVVKLP